MRRFSDPIGFSLRVFVFLISMAIVQPAITSASDDIVTIIVRFAEGEVVFPEGAYENTAPLEEIIFRTEQLRTALAGCGAFALTLVCPEWRHLEGPQYDVNGNEIEVEQMVDFTDVYRLEWNGSVPAEQIGLRLRDFSQVLYVDLMPFMELDYEDPNDPIFPGQWGLHNTAQTYPNFQCTADFDINALEAWDFQDSTMLRVGILDLGIDKDHEDLVDAADPDLWFGPNQGQEDCPNWPHGSAVAGIVGATGGNALGVTGVASPRGGRLLVSMRANPPDDPCAVGGAEAADALAWACSGAVFPKIRIVNNSWGGNRQHMENQGFFKSVRDAFRNAYLKGLFLTASSGNRVDPPLCPPELFYPAAFRDYTTAVGSILCDGSHPYCYNTGDFIDLVAPGGAVPDSNVDHIVTTWGDDTNDKYWGVGDKPYFGGTSASAPHVAGVAALISSKVPSLANDDIDAILKATARDLGNEGHDAVFGYGLVRADSALSLVSPPSTVIHSKTSPVRTDSVGTTAPRDFMNIPCITQVPEQIERLTTHVYEMVGYAPFSEPALAVWTRGRWTNGWRDIRRPPVADESGPYDGLSYGNWAEVVDGTVTAEGCSLRTYTYKFFRDGQFVGWYPVDGTTGWPACSVSSKPTSLAYTYVIGGGSPLAGGSPELQLRIQGPNLSSPLYRFSWSLTERERVDAAIFDVAGRRLRLLFSGSAGPGEVRLTWDGRDSADRRVRAGIYFLRITAGSLARSGKLLVAPKGGGPQ